MFFSKIITSCLLLIMLGSAAYTLGQTLDTAPKKIGPQQPSLSHVQALILARKSNDRAVRRRAWQTRYSEAIAMDLASGDPAAQKAAIQILNDYLSDYNNHRRTNVKQSQMWLQDFLNPLLALKQYDLTIALARMNLSGSLDNPGYVDKLQLCLVNTYLAEDKDDQALAAAKTYYDVCLLQHTTTAIQLISQALINTRLKDDPTIVQRFKQQQIALAQAPAANSAPAPDSSQNILLTIKPDTKPYLERIKQMEASGRMPSSVSDLMNAGNLYLLADMPDKAKKYFSLAIDIAPNPKITAVAIASVARAIRAANGSVGAANAYLQSMQNGGSK